MESSKLNSFFFVGKDPPENPHIGDIWGSGAPVNSSRRKCEYCGVEYRKISYKN